MRSVRRILLVLVLTTAVHIGIGASARAGDGSSELGLPWATGETWTLTSGTHSWTGEEDPESSLDFSGGSGVVRAAGPGIVHRDGPCGPSFVRIDHLNGWNTSYYHLEGIGVFEGDHVARGDELGHIGMATACGGRADGPHVHFTLWRFNGTFNFQPEQESDWVGVDIGGYTVSSSGYRQACMRHISDGETQCTPPGAHIYNDGAVGSGERQPGNQPLPVPVPG